MTILKFIKDYWVQIIFLSGFLWAVIVFCKAMVDAMKCSLRNDILDIYDKCKENKRITHYQLESIQYSFTLYKRLKGNSFVSDIVERVKLFELVD